MYLNYQPKHGYNSYIDAAADDLGTQMDVGLLILEPGEQYSISEQEKECAVLLWEGAAQLYYGGQSAHISRTDCFRAEGYCLRRDAFGILYPENQKPARVCPGALYAGDCAGRA